jgi:methionyl aminopeptidase
MVYVKSEKEIDLMRESCKIVKDTLAFVESKIAAGISTKEIDEWIEKYIKSAGAYPSCLGYGGYPASSCISVNDVVVHGIPSHHQILKEGDIVSVDLCAYKNGYHGDACRTFKIGKVSQEAEKLVKVTEECFFKAIENLRDGTPIGNIGSAVQKHAESNGFSVVRALVGHGIGQKMHEDPSVPNYGVRGTGIRLKKGMTIAIEPMINAGVYQVEFLSDGWTCKTKDRLPSAHYENTVAITEDGVEILTL